MSTPRPWPFPDLRNGPTLHHVTDTHFGPRASYAYLADWHRRSETDIAYLRVATNAGHLATGDLINAWFGSASLAQARKQRAQQRRDFQAWRAAITGADGKPFALATGNHDMSGPEDADGTWHPITGDQWAAFYGLPSVNNTWDMGEIRVITLGPEKWESFNRPNPYRKFLLPTGTLDWLDAELSADSRPTFLAAHVPTAQQYPDDFLTVNGQNPRFDDIVGAHGNVVGYLCGHRHNDVDANPDLATVVTVGGRRIFTVCGPAAGGKDRWTGVGPYEDTSRQWVPNANCSLYLTLLHDDTLDVRYRDHDARQWTINGRNARQHLLLRRS
jgi:hypothetical protein